MQGFGGNSTPTVSGPSWKTPQDEWYHLGPSTDLTPVYRLPDEVTVVIAMGSDGGRDLRRAVDSVRLQSSPPAEILVLDDGSNPAAIAALRGLSVNILTQAGTGLAGARNQGVTLARHDILAFMTSADVWPADCLAGQLSLLQTRPEVDVVLGQVQAVDGPLQSDPSLAFNMGAALVRRSAFSRVGLFEASEADDLEWFMRAKELGLQVEVRDRITLWTALASPTTDPAADRRALKRKKSLTLKRINKEGLGPSAQQG